MPDACEDNNEYQVTERGRFDLKRQRLEPPLLTRISAAKRAQKVIDIEDTRAEKGRYNPHRKRHRGKPRCSAVMAMVEHNRQAGTEGWNKEALINWVQQCEPEPISNAGNLVT